MLYLEVLRNEIYIEVFILILFFEFFGFFEIFEELFLFKFLNKCYFF